MLAIAALALIVGSCSSEEADSSGGDAPATSAAKPDGAVAAGAGRWVGAVDGTDAFLAVVSDGESTTAYLCDGAAIDSWFKASAGDELQAASDEIVLDAERDGDAWTGTVSLADGSTHEFSASRSDDEVLFRSEGTDDGASWLGGWIVDDGEQRGSLVVRTATTTTQSAPTLDTSTLTLSGTSTSTVLVVQPISPLQLPTGSTTVTNSWTVAGRVTRSASGIGGGGVSVQFARTDGAVVGTARTSANGTYRLTMSVPTAPIVVNVAVLDKSARSLVVSSPAQVTTVPNGVSTVNVVLA